MLALACWDDNSYGKATPPAGSFSQVSAGWDHTCGLKTDGSLTCRGRDDSGQATPPAGTFIQVSAGYFHTCAIKSDSSFWLAGAIMPMGRPRRRLAASARSARALSTAVE